MKLMTLASSASRGQPGDQRGSPKEREATGDHGQ